MSDDQKNEIAFISPDQFQKIIRDRRAEYTEERKRKRHDYLRRIQDMKSKTGVDPLKLFPKEIWLMIMNELEPVDQMHLGQVHKMFRGLMEESFIGSTLLPQILGFEVERRWLWPDDALQSWNRNTRRPIAHYRELRLVSKTMRNAVDRWFENDVIAKLHSEQFSHYSCPSVVTCFELAEKSNFHRLGKILEDPNPETHLRFFTRSISFIYPGPTETWDPFNELATCALLDRIGDQIWYFSFEVPGTRSPEWSEEYLKMCYRLLVEWLAKMPKLKWLSLRLVLEKENELFDLPNELSLPSLDYLERVDLNCNVPQFANIFLNAKINPKLKILGFLVTDSLDYMKISRIQSLPVEGLIVERWGGWTHPLQSITSKMWPLKWAHINLGLPESVFSTYRYLSNFKTLERLSIRFFVAKDLGNDIDISFLELPNLVEFEVLFNKPEIKEWNDTANFFMTFQYLLYAEKLKRFSWSCSMLNCEINRTCRNLEEYDHVDGKITFGGCWPNLKKSNIFKVFPALDSVRMLLYNVDEKCWNINRTFSRESILYSSNKIKT